MLRTIHLHGNLGNQYGDRYQLDVATAGEAIRALATQLNGFQDALENGSWALVRGDYETGFSLDLGDVNDFQLGNADLHIVPAVQGSKNQSGFLKIILGAALVGAAIFFAPATAGGLTASIGGTGVTYGHLAIIGAGLMLAGVAQLLSPSEDGDEEEKQSFTMSGPGNTYEQGGPVPIVYGEVFTGGVTISAGLDIENLGAEADGGAFDLEYDEHFGNVLLLMNMDGPNSTHEIYDQSTYAWTPTHFNWPDTLADPGNLPIYIDQNTHLLGETPSAYFTGTDFLFLARNDPYTGPVESSYDLDNAATGVDGFALGTDDFTIEVAFKPDGSQLSGTGTRLLAHHDFEFGDIIWDVAFDYANTRVVSRFFDADRTATGISKSVPSIGSDQVVFVALERSGSTLRLYINGVMEASKTANFNLIAPTIGGIGVGGYSGDANSYFKGWMDGVRITKGIARYATDSQYDLPEDALPTRPYSTGVFEAP